MANEVWLTCPCCWCSVRIDDLEADLFRTFVLKAYDRARMAFHNALRKRAMHEPPGKARDWVVGLLNSGRYADNETVDNQLSLK